MKKKTVKSFRGILPSPSAILTTILLTAIICVSVGVVYTKASGRITLLSTAVTEFDNSKPALGQSDEWQTVQMYVTAYCPCQKCCGGHSDGRTACGHKILPGDAFVAADETYCFGTEMLIASYNNGEPVKVLDRGGAIRGNRLDVFFHSHEEALKWGVRHLSVKIRRK